MTMPLQPCYCKECGKAVGMCEYYGFKIVCAECAVSLARVYEAVGFAEGQEITKVFRNAAQYDLEKKSEFMRSRVATAIYAIEQEIHSLSENDETIMAQIQDETGT